MTRELLPFYPPQSNRWITWLIQYFANPLTRVLYKFDIQVSPTDIVKLKALEENRLVYVCNHPSMEDGPAMFCLSAQLGQQFNYIVTWNFFRGLQGKLLQALGCYSIRRGLGDRASITQTLNLLKSPRCRLAIFPEGGCTYQNDKIIPFLSGAVQMPLKAMDQLTKQADTKENHLNLYLIPVSLKYSYVQSLKLIIEQILQDLEAELNLQFSTNEFYDRLIAIETHILEQLEREFSVASDKQLTLNQRIARLRQHAMAQCKQRLKLDLPDNRSLRERVYKIQAVLQAKLPQTQDDKALYWQTVRLLNFDSIYDDYIDKHSSLERYLDTLMRLESETYKAEYLKPKAFRRAKIKIGNPINLKTYVDAYRADKTGTVEKLTQQLQTTVQNNLLTP